MNIRKRLVLMLVVVFLLLAGCGGGVAPTPIVITATPGMEPTTIVITATPAPADPTPTQEVGGQYITVNGNPFFAGPIAEFRLPSDDTLRYQVLGDGYEPTARYYAESGVRVAPYINREPLNDGSGNARLLMEFVQIAGEFGIRTRVNFSAGQCYILKQRGYMRLGSGNMNNLALGGRIYLSENGSALEMQEQAFPSRNGSYETTWRLRPLTNVSTYVEVYLMVRWAEFSVAEAVASALDVDVVELTPNMMLDYYLSQAPAVNEINSFEVILAPQAECPSGATWEW